MAKRKILETKLGKEKAKETALEGIYIPHMSIDETKELQKEVEEHRPKDKEDKEAMEEFSYWMMTRLVVDEDGDPFVDADTIEKARKLPIHKVQDWTFAALETLTGKTIGDLMNASNSSGSLKGTK